MKKCMQCLEKLMVNTELQAKQATNNQQAKTIKLVLTVAESLFISLCVLFLLSS